MYCVVLYAIELALAENGGVAFEISLLRFLQKFAASSNSICSLFAHTANRQLMDVLAIVMVGLRRLMNIEMLYLNSSLTVSFNI